jgi:uncharacterized RDD family membrane protein YckC
MRTDLTIRTPEGIAFSYSLAGPISRCMAWIVDFLVTVALSTALSTGLGMLGAISPDLAAGVTFIAYFALFTGYGIVLEWLWRGRTIGKWMFRLRVMDADGFRLRFEQVLIRNLLRPVDALPFFYLVGGIACLVSRRAQRLGDLVAGTVVVHNHTHSEPDVEQLLGGKYNSLQSHPHLAARLRQRSSPEDARLALQAILRREEFEPAARVALFRRIADHFRQLVPFPAESVESVPDEQYIRNVVDVLFRTRSDRAEKAGGEGGRERLAKAAEEAKLA